MGGVTSIYRANQTIGTLYHFASPAASGWIAAESGDGEAEVERTGSRKQYYTYRRRGRSARSRQLMAEVYW